MNKSENIKEIAVALAKFQEEVKNPSNTTLNPFLNIKYAPLSEVINTIKPILAKNGLAVIQDTRTEDGNVIISTTIIHSSGEWIESGPLAIKPERPTAQGIGSAITYGRRYSLAAILGISSEDDNDGNPVEEQPKQQPKQGANPRSDNNMITDSQNKAIHTLCNKIGLKNDKEIHSYISGVLHKDIQSTKELTRQEASDVISELNKMRP